MYGIFHIRSVSVGLDSQIWYLFIYITGYLNVGKYPKRWISGRSLVLYLLYYKILFPWMHWVLYYKNRHFTIRAPKARY